MFKRMATAVLVMGAALTVLPAGAFAQDRYEYRDDYRYDAPYVYRYDNHEYRERYRHAERDRDWRAHEWRERQWREREHREHERREHAREYRYRDDSRYWR